MESQNLDPEEIEFFKRGHLSGFKSEDGNLTLYGKIITAIESHETDLTFIDIFGALELVSGYYKRVLEHSINRIIEDSEEGGDNEQNIGD